MKTLLINVLVAGAVLFAGASAADAQPQDGQRGQRPDAAQMAQMRANQVKKVVTDITDEQYNQVLSLYKSESEAMEKAMSQGRDNMDREAMMKQRTESETKLKAILSESQYKVWSKSEESHRGPGGPGGNGRPERHTDSK